jgi:hypothetical protein
MPSVSILPESHEVYVVWREGQATVSEIQLVRQLISEVSNLSLQEFFHLTRDTPRYRVGRLPYLRALEVRRVCQASGIVIELE